MEATDAEIAVVCRHCSRPMKLRRRGLCWGCYHEPGVRERYPATSIMANRGHGLTLLRVTPDNREKRRLARLPCSCPPGSVGKVQMLEDRASLGLPLWNVGDARQDDEGAIKLADLSDLFGK